MEEKDLVKIEVVGHELITTVSYCIDKTYGTMVVKI